MSRVMISALLVAAIAAVGIVGLGCGGAIEVEYEYEISSSEPAVSGELVADIENPLGAPVFDMHDEMTLGFSLVAAIENEGIFLYGRGGSGMTLYKNGRITRFDDWRWLQPRFIFPQLMYYDFDGDGERELAVILPAGSGTGVSLFNLHIVRDGGDSVVSLLAHEIHEWMTEPLTGEFSEGFLGSIVRFEFEGNGIKVTIGMGKMHEGLATSQFLGEIQADVIFDGESLALSNHTFALFPPM